MNGLRLIAVLVLCGVMGAGRVCAADTIAPTVIAIVDVQRILQESKAAKSVQRQIETHRSKFQAEISGEEKELRTAEQKLTSMREAGPSAAFAEQEQKLRQRFMSVERHVQARRKALDQAYTEAMSTVRSNIIEIVEKVSRERGVNLAIVKQQVIWNDKAIDITGEVLTRLNQKVPEIQVVVQPEPKGEPELPPFNKGPSSKPQ